MASGASGPVREGGPGTGRRIASRNPGRWTFRRMAGEADDGGRSRGHEPGRVRPAGVSAVPGREPQAGRRAARAKLATIALALGLVAVGGCGEDSETWSGVVHPDVDELTGMWTGLFRTYGPTRRSGGGVELYSSDDWVLLPSRR